MKCRDRIVELRRVPASQLAPNPKNWRIHPTNQHNVLRGLLSEIGISAAAIAVERPEGLVLSDGHLRSEIAGNEILPVLIVDLNDAEADQPLTTFDGVSALTTGDPDKLEQLQSEISAKSEAVQAMLDKMAAYNGITAPTVFPIGQRNSSAVGSKEIGQRSTLWRDLHPMSRLKLDFCNHQVCQDAVDHWH